MSDGGTEDVPKRARRKGGGQNGVITRRGMLAATGASLTATTALTTSAATQAPAAADAASVSVLAFGAKPDARVAGAAVGGTDNSRSFQAAVDALPASGGELVVPAGRFKLSTTLRIGTKRIHIRGAGKEATQILFAPSGPATAIEFGDYSGIAYFQGLHDLTVTSPDTAQRKILVHLKDCSGFSMTGVNLIGSVDNGHANYLFGGSGGSIGLQTNGRDSSQFVDLLISAQRPIVIGPNPNHSISADHFNFDNCYLLGSLGTGAHATDYPLITIEDSPRSGTFPHYTAVSNLSFTGYQAWVGGGHALQWIDTTSEGISNNVLIENVRHEQSHNVAKAVLYIARSNANLHGLTIRNFSGGSNDGVAVPGLFARRVSGQLILEGFNYLGSHPDKSGLDIDESVTNTIGIGCFFQTGGGRAIAGQTVVGWSPGNSPAPLPANFELVSAAAGPPRSISDSWASGSPIGLADGERRDIAGRTATGMLLVSDSQGGNAIFALDGVRGSVDLIADPRETYSTMPGTSGRTSVSLVRERYTLQNNTGRRTTYHILRVGTPDGGQ